MIRTNAVQDLGLYQFIHTHNTLQIFRSQMKLIERTQKYTERKCTHVILALFHLQKKYVDSICIFNLFSTSIRRRKGDFRRNFA